MKKRTSEPSLAPTTVARLFDKMDQLSGSIAELDKKFELHSQDTSFKLEKIATQDEQQNALLSEHAARSTALQADVELRANALWEGVRKVEARVGTLEAPGKLRKLAWRRVIDIITRLTAIAGLVYVLFEFFRH